MDSVLVYHTINYTGSASDCQEMISTERFEQQLRWLARWRRVVPLTETLKRSHRDLPVAITFDDGYRDNLTIALPLLEKYRLPMTLFVVAGFVGRGKYFLKNDPSEKGQNTFITI